MFSSDRYALRQIFFTTWQKYLSHLPMEPLEANIIQVVLLHPEYQDMLAHPDHYQDKDFVESNPFLHMSLHIALQEQLHTNRPHGIKEIHQHLCKQLGDSHVAEHKMMECLATLLWNAQHNIPPDEQVYLNDLRQL